MYKQIAVLAFALLVSSVSGVTVPIGIFPSHNLQANSFTNKVIFK